MFENHQPRIAEYVETGPDAFEHVFQFVVATIQQSIENTPAIVEGFQREGVESRDAWGMKGPAIEWMAENKQREWKTARQIRRESLLPDAELIYHFASYPGLGIVKGGFLAQLASGVGGCIDSHNLKRFGVDPNRFKASRFKNLKTESRRVDLVNEYCRLIAYHGGCETLWNGWCDHVASLRPDVFGDGFEVSELHCTALGLGRRTEEIPF